MGSWKPEAEGMRSLEERSRVHLAGKRMKAWGKGTKSLQVWGSRVGVCDQCAKPVRREDGWAWGLREGSLGGSR